MVEKIVGAALRTRCRALEGREGAFEDDGGRGDEKREDGGRCAIIFDSSWAVAKERK